MEKKFIDPNIFELYVLNNSCPYLQQSTKIKTDENSLIVTLNATKLFRPTDEHLDLIIVKLFYALDYLHQRNIVHNNLIMSSLFSEGLDGLTNKNLVLGNFAYSFQQNYYVQNLLKLNENSAPEMFEKEDNLKKHSPSCQSDLWSLGALIFHLEQKIPLFKIQTEPSASPQLELLQHLNRLPASFPLQKNYDSPNLIQAHNRYVNWNLKWTQFAIKYFFHFEPEKRMKIENLLKLPEIKKIVDEHRLTDYLKVQIRRNLKENGNIQEYLKDLNFWNKHFKIEPDEKTYELLIRLYHYVQSLELSKKNKVYLTWYLIRGMQEIPESIILEEEEYRKYKIKLLGSVELGVLNLE